MTAILRAAELRAQGVSQRSHRPSQRRNQPHVTDMHVRFASDMTIRQDAEESPTVEFRGYASTYNAPYEMWDMFGPYSEVVSPGAAAESLARDGLDVPLVLGHDPMRRIARTVNGSLRLSEDAHGLLVDADLDPEDPDAGYAITKIRSGLLDEMSFMFRIIKGTWSPDFTEYRIDAFDIHRGDVSIVGFGANPGTDAGVRSPADVLRTRLTLAAAL